MQTRRRLLALALVSTACAGPAPDPSTTASDYAASLLRRFPDVPLSQDAAGVLLPAGDWLESPALVAARAAPVPLAGDLEDSARALAAAHEVAGARLGARFDRGTRVA